MSKLSMLFCAALCVVCATSLSGCGKPDPANAKVGYFLAHPNALQQQRNWCGKQGNPQMIFGCQSGAIADFLIQRKLTGWVTKPEPVPGKDATYFSAVRKLPSSPQYSDAQGEFDWCLTHYFLKTHQVPNPAAMGFFNITPYFSSLSKSCAAIYQVRRN